MRYIYFSAIILFCACNTGEQSSNTATSSTDSGRTIVRTDTIYLTRNADITPANSYSDLFLDSSTVENFIQTKKLADDEAKSFRSFYNYRNLQFAWFTSLGFTEQAKGFWNLQDKFSTKTDKGLRNRMDTLLNMDTLVISRFDTSIVNTELSLTNAYLQFYKNNRDKTLFAAVSPEKAIPVKKENAVSLSDSMLVQRVDSSGSNRSVSQYLLLKQKLQLYNSIAKQGGWRTIIFTGKLIKKGTSSPVIALIKNRLQLTGYMGGTDTSKIYNDSLVTAIKNYQQRNGMKPTGIITDTLVRSLNVPVDKRIQQIIINLNRMQWMSSANDANYVTVNIPEFMLYAYENNAKVFEMPVVVGKEGTLTTMFNGNLNQVVFSPYWNIPASIVKNEILPKMKSDPNYLKSKNMEVVRKNDTLPVIRQLPGKDNALGKVKFLFPNRYDIYFHDTYAKEIFKKDVRAISHGCIRLADAEKMANYLLRNNNAWSPEKIHAAMNSGKEQYVKVDPAMPVTITYFTAWVDETGQLNFRDDVYGNDKRISQMMFANYISPTSSIVSDSSKIKDSVKK
ncbi:MAG TPA: L,D-transpeptidase family protein [Chitinophagaceae bacterium]|nr:L,D-transpeptidase family protein [Chitinophagaceae bacterium]